MGWRDTITTAQAPQQPAQGQQQQPTSWRDTITDYVRPVGVGEALGAGFAQGATFGFADEAYGAARTAMSDIASVFSPGDRQPQVTRDEHGRVVDIQDDQAPSYEAHRDEARDYFAGVREQRPVTSTVGEIGGAVGSSIATGGLGLIGRGTQAARGASAGRLVGAGAAEGALYGVGASEGNSAGDITKDALAGGAIGAGGGALGVGIGRAAGKAGRWWTGAKPDAPVSDVVANYVEQKARATTKAPGKVSRKALEFVTGADEKKMVDYMANPAAQRKTRELGEIAVDISEDVAKLDDVAKARFAAVSPNKGVAKPVDEISFAVNDGLESLKTRVIEGSRRAVDTLPDDLTVPVRNITREIQSIMAPLKRGKTKVSASALNEMDYMLKRFKADKAEALPGREVKNIVKELDQSIELSDAAGTFASPTHQAMQRLRRFLDETLKSASPEYRQAMVPVAQDASALNAASKVFGKVDKATSTLKAIAKNPAAKREAEAALRAFDERMGTRFYDDNMLRHVTEEFNKAVDKGRMSEFVNINKAQFPFLGDMAKDAKRYDIAKSMFSRPGAAKTKLQAYGNQPEKNLHVEQTLGYVDDTLGTNFADENRARALRGYFDQDLSGGRGPRNKITGAVVGGMLGGWKGAAAGYATGSAVDRYGGQITRSVLDTAVNVSKKPGAQTIGRILQESPEALGKFSGVLARYAEKGQTALGAGHYVLWQNSPEYREMWEKGLATALDEL